MGSAVRAPVEVHFQTTGVEAVRRGLRLVRDEVNTTSESGARGFGDMGGAVREAAYAMTEISREGKVSQRAIRGLIGSAAEFGAMLGPESALLAAVGFLGVTFYNVFKRARDEMEQTKKKFEDDLTQMVNAGDNAQLLKKAGDLWKGTPAAHFRDGIVGVGKAMGETLDQLKAYGVTLDENNQFVLNGVISSNREHAIVEGLKHDYRDLEEKLKTLRGQLQDVREAILETNNTPLTIQGLAGMKTTADSPDKLPADAAGSAALDALNKRVEQGALHVRLINDDLMTSVQEERRLVEGLWGQYLNVNTTAAQRVEILKKIEELQKDINLQSEPLAIPKTAVTAVTGKDNPLLAAEEEIAKAAKEAQKRVYGTLQQGFAQTIGSAITDGITAGFSGGGIAGAFRAATKAVLAGIGSMMVSLGEVYLEYGAIMQSLAALLPNPFTAGAAGLAIGAALIAMGAALGAVAHGGGGGAGARGAYVASGGSLGETITRGIISPYPQPSTQGMQGGAVVNHNYIIGPADPVAQRMWDELQRRSKQRGQITGA